MLLNDEPALGGPHNPSMGHLQPFLPFASAGEQEKDRMAITTDIGCGCGMHTGRVCPPTARSSQLALALAVACPRHAHRPNSGPLLWGMQSRPKIHTRPMDTDILSAPCVSLPFCLSRPAASTNGPSQNGSTQSKARCGSTTNEVQVQDSSRGRPQNMNQYFASTLPMSS